jgi:aspartyl-tRNA(Asn)/glutamyl-tRNA(Gln) amidotransferase subunit B
MHETVVGLEIHIQLDTASKVFCGDSTAFGAPPNTQISSVSLGYPGTLPRLNAQVVALAVRLGVALGCEISRYSTFDRKNYFYADLPKGYQITQNTNPICIGGGIEIEVNGAPKWVRLHHIHIEEDAGKSIHDLADNQSFIDLNRAGVPLLEVVTEPDMRSGEEAAAVVTALRQLVRHLGVSDGNMEQGSMRCDCNVSVRPFGQTAYNPRCEVKNINSMRNIRRAIAHEAERQAKIYENGGTVAQQTRSFDAADGTTFALRSKEEAQDYRYMPDPDLPPIVLTDSYLADIRAAMPLLPKAIIDDLQTNDGLSSYDAKQLANDIDFLNYYKTLISNDIAPKNAANALLNFIKSYLHTHEIELSQLHITPQKLAALLQLVENGTVNKQAAEGKIFAAMRKNTAAEPLDLAHSLDLMQTNNTDDIAQIIDAVLAKYPAKVAEYQKGKKGLIGFFVGEVVKAAKGKIDPKTANELISKAL